MEENVYDGYTHADQAFPAGVGGEPPQQPVQIPPSRPEDRDDQVPTD